LLCKFTISCHKSLDWRKWVSLEENLYLIVVVLEVMEWAKFLGLKAFFIKNYFANSYEHVEWPFIVTMLHALGFGHLFV